MEKAEPPIVEVINDNPQRSHGTKTCGKNLEQKYTLRRLKKELAHRPEILRLILYLQKCVLRKKKAVKKIKSALKRISRQNSPVKLCNTSSQTDETVDSKFSEDSSDRSAKDWKVGSGTPWENTVEETSSGLSLVDQVKEAAEKALQQNGMVYEATSGMYYDFNTGYYYNAEMGLYYHGTTGCYYYYDEKQKQYVYHSHADTSQFTTPQEYQTSASQDTTEKPKRKHKKDKDGTIGKPKQSKDSLKNADQTEQSDDTGAKRSKPNNKSQSASDVKDVPSKILDSSLSNVPDKTELVTASKELIADSREVVVESKECSVDISKTDDNAVSVSVTERKYDGDQNTEVVHVTSDPEDGECSESEDDESNFSTDSSDSNESVVNRYPPCMRIIIQETSHDKLKVGTLFLLTKDGGTLGREGGSHAVIIPEENVSRHHLTFKYNDEKSSYFAMDMGSRNGTILNGKRMSSAQQESDPMEVVHGSIIQLGSTKLLCHIHNGNSTCGHCEPGLLIKDSATGDSPVYKPSNIKTQHKKELRRLKIKFGVNPFKENDDAGHNVLPEGYEDKAQKRREKVGSQHHGAKTEQASLDTSIASTNKGFKMLEKMGWSAGEGLGKEAQGKKEPVAIVTNIGKSGLGTAGAQSAMPRAPPPPAKSKVWLATKLRFDKLATAAVFNDEDEIDEDSESSDGTDKTKK